MFVLSLTGVRNYPQPQALCFLFQTARKCNAEFTAASVESAAERGDFTQKKERKSLPANSLRPCGVLHASAVNSAYILRITRFQAPFSIMDRASRFAVTSV
jgi:ankyrin repeat protein